MESMIPDTEQLQELTSMAAGMAMNYLPQLLLAVITLVVGLWLINRFVTALDRKLTAKDPTLGRFVTGLVSILFKIILLISVASMVGIATTSFIAVLGAAGLAVGLALQGSLANFAGGVLILIFKPFKVGDVIEAQGFLGTVKEIQILYTVVDTFDNRQVVMPNASLSNASLTNYSAYPNRRVDMTIGISYTDDIQKAREVIQKTLATDERILRDPEPMIVVGDLGDSSVDLKVRIWANGDDLWFCYWHMLEQIKVAFDQNGITIPYPQRDVHHYQSAG
ncbi:MULTISPECIES: mechanosensitive ion channel family protein [Gammaproteobacteria]|uniref:Small-conductance mechanosensitive channel n=1 Tax=Vreelandella halophila TaxID=86177 RepID=A0A9X4YCT1_9GAMM|nr:MULTISPECIES: mechanosensitive ion channel domain-containing protein [Gammaproteobacteria]KAA8983451.1 mechanosensitive ion channel [Halospina sp. K52047b]MYL27136.1 mechanosensitive ion channel [Halomonas utahensis]MYL74338.1 mechanosensitive ion channel [Halomonas sp. 22501_18_FS]